MISGTSRRGFLLWLTVGSLSHYTPAGGRSRRVELSVAEPAVFRRHSIDAINRRFEVYRASGVEFLRTSVSFRQQKRNGDWLPDDVEWLKLARRFAFKMRVQFEVLSGPPLWFLQDNPRAKLFDNVGEFSRNMISPFWPGSGELVKDVTTRMAKWWQTNGYFEHSSSVIADLGPAGEPLYPPAWTMGKGRTPASSSFWFFGNEASQRFREWAIGKYGSSGAASRAWNMADEEQNWARLFRADLAYSPQGRDLLTWYFEAKRALVTRQLSLTDRIIKDNKSNSGILMLLPAGRLNTTPPDNKYDILQDPYLLKIGADMDYDIGQAIAFGCTIQYTGLPSYGDISHIKRFLKLNRRDNPVWGENVGVEAVSKQFESIADEVAVESLAGFEFVGVESLFGADGNSPTEILERWQKTMRNLTNTQ